MTDLADLLADEVARLKRQLADRNHEAKARADLLIEERARLASIAAVADRIGDHAIADAIREAIGGPVAHPDDLGGVSDDGHPMGEPPSCFRCKHCGRTGEQ